MSWWLFIIQWRTVALGGRSIFFLSLTPAHPLPPYCICQWRSSSQPFLFSQELYSSITHCLSYIHCLSIHLLFLLSTQTRFSISISLIMTKFLENFLESFVHTNAVCTSSYYWHINSLTHYNRPGDLGIPSSGQGYQWFPCWLIQKTLPIYG